MDWRPSETIGANYPSLIQGRSLAALRVFGPYGAAGQPNPSLYPSAQRQAGLARSKAVRLDPPPASVRVRRRRPISYRRFADTQILVTYPGRLRPSHPPRLRPTDVCFHNCRASSQRAAPLIDGKTHSLEAFIGSEGAILKVSWRTTGRLPDPENNYLREGG